MRLCLLLFIAVCLISCTPRGRIITMNHVEIQPFLYLSTQEAILLSFPQNLSQADFKTVRASMIEGARMRGFIDVLDIDEHDYELRAAQINDFSLDRNIQRLYDNLGVGYLLDMQIISRKPFRVSGLSSQLLYRELQAPNFAGSPGLMTETEHQTIIKYTLYQTDGAVPVATMEVLSSHLQNNRLDNRVLRKELEMFFYQIFAAVQ